MTSVIVRGSTVYFSFEFIDENDDVAVCDSATLQLTWPGRDGYETETLTLTESDGAWLVEWDSAKSRPGWVQYHAHALAGAGTAQFARDGRFRLRGNRAGLDHDALPGGGEISDYEFLRTP